MQRLRPSLVEPVAECGSPSVAHRTVARGVDLAEQHRNDLMHAAHVIERRNGWLNDGGRAIDGTDVAPALERMGERKLPLAMIAGLVALQADMDRCGDLLERLGKAERHWRCIDGVGIDHDHRIHLPGAHVGNQIMQGMRVGRSFDRSRKVQGLARIP